MLQLYRCNSKSRIDFERLENRLPWLILALGNRSSTGLPAPLKSIL